MVDDGRNAPPYGVILAVVVGIVVAGPMFLNSEAMLESFAEILSPVGLLLVPIILLLLIRFLSSSQGTSVSNIFSAGEPDSIHRLGGSPVGVALLLVLILFLLYNRISLFRSSDDDSGD